MRNKTKKLCSAILCGKMGRAVCKERPRSENVKIHKKTNKIALYKLLKLTEFCS